MRKILVTGCAGFIGSNLTDKLLEEGYKVVGVDNFNDYYDPKVKEKNISEALKNKNFKIYEIDILDFDKLKEVFGQEKPSAVIHLAARAGVRPSIDYPMLYAQTNVLGTVNLLRLSVEHRTEKFIYGSSSSVYGNSPKIPFAEDDLCQNIISPYGASKRAGEFFVESFYKCYGLNATILRFFTVYGKRGRPDMAPAKFSQSIVDGKEITQYGDGRSKRDYTYIDDIVEGILKSLLLKTSNFEAINLGGNSQVILSDFIRLIEDLCKKKALLNVSDEMPGDAKQTYADILKAKKLLRWKPTTNVVTGLRAYISWLKSQG